MAKQIEFSKYHGTGNDFILIDARREGDKHYTREVVNFLCNRHSGIGADGLILLLGSDTRDFHMKYFNSDGNESTMCGNGGRCITAFARNLGIVRDKASFTGIDGDHIAYISDNNMVDLRMIDVENISRSGNGYFLNTGSPHFVIVRKDVLNIDVFREGREIRYHPEFAPSGTNVNFMEIIGANEIIVRTYERGVENETLSCGTGSVASAITACFINKPDICSFIVQTSGGKLGVRFKTENYSRFTDVWLSGPAQFVFKGEIQKSLF